MRTISYKLCDLGKARLAIGYVGENEHTQVRIDCEEIFAEYPQAEATMVIMPPAGSAYPKTVTTDGTTVIWTVTDSDLAAEGEGELQLTFTENSVIVKSVVSRYRVTRSIIGSGEAPDPVQDWVDDANDLLADLEEKRDTDYWKGDPGEPGQDGAPGRDGQDGHTPVKGTDYWTAEDKAEIVSDVESAIIDDTAGEGDTSKTWSADKIDSEIADVKTDITKENTKLDEIALNGKYIVSEGSQDTYYQLTTGRINNVYDLTVITDNGCGNVFVPKEQMPSKFYFDDTKYKANYCFAKNGKLVANTYTAWQTSSPLTYTEPNDYDSIGINVKKLSGSYASGELNSALYKKGTSVEYFGNLATKDFVSSNIQKRLKCIYPDGFTSRIKPDIWFDGGFRADINPDDYKISGTSEVWIATNGNDTTGDGTESKPYATITKALTTDAINVHIKEGTYTQGTHYSTSTNFGGRNVIGHGTVVLQSDSSGHYPYSSGSVYIENITIKHGHSTTGKAYHATCTGSGQTACFVNCVFRDGGENGLSVTGIDCICIGCVSYGNKLDGFNYHAKDIEGTTYIPNALEIDCVAYNNGSDQSGSDSCNGSTAHEGVQIVRLNGEYYSCYGGVIAEIAETSQPTTISVNFGVLAHDSTGTGTYKASFWASKNTKMYLYDCSCYGGTYDMSAIDNALIVSRRLTTGRDVPAINPSQSETIYQY